MLASNKMSTLFPLPSLPPSRSCPDRFPGITYESKVALIDALKNNHEQRHGYTNDRGFHNHTSHQLLAVFAMGAPPSLYDTILRVQAERTLPAIKTSAVTIDKDNFYSYLGDISYYDGYLRYFYDVVLNDGAASALDQYVFSREANFQNDGSAQSPRQMLNRLFGRLYHPMIYVGCGLEFGIPGLVAEGLAQISTHPPDAPRLVSASDFDFQDTFNDNSIATLTHGLSFLAEGRSRRVTNTHAVKGENVGVHAFSVLARIMQDDRFISLALKSDERGRPDSLLDDKQVPASLRELICEYAMDWSVDGRNAEQVQAKIEELSWMATLIYGIGGWGGRSTSPGGNLNADFFLMHQVTSALFLPAFVAYLPPSSIAVFLRTYFLTCLTWWVARGRPALPIREFYSSVTATPALPGPDNVKGGTSTLSPENPTPNAWLSITQTAIMHSDHHLCKVQRALAHFATRYGERPAGHFTQLLDVMDMNLDGIELLDGTLFVRVASLTAERVGWLRDGQEIDFWDFHGFFT